MDKHQSPLDWLFATQAHGVHPGLERMHSLLAVLGNAEQRLKCLHVAGTNGKGSVCAFAESVLRADGYRTGLYTSPHLVDFSERIRIAGVPVAAQGLEEGIRRLQGAVQDWREEELPTFFELVTALAFDLFARAGCDIVVLETGLGGRLDATNTAPKLACAITPIGLDHTEWLGETLREIALEKAGIFRPGIPAVIAPQAEEVSETLASVASEWNVPCVRMNESLVHDFELGLAGSHQRSNAALALALVRAGGFQPSEESVRRGLSEVFWPGRFQRLLGGSLILDGAHNLHAAQQLVDTWREEFGSRKCRLIFGALSDKDPKAMIAVLESIASEVMLVPVASPRSMDPAALSRHLHVPHRMYDSLQSALTSIFSLPTDGKTDLHTAIWSPVLLTGSLFLVGEALALESGRSAISRSQ